MSTICNAQARFAQQIYSGRGTFWKFLHSEKANTKTINDIPYCYNAGKHGGVLILLKTLYKRYALARTYLAKQGKS